MSGSPVLVKLTRFDLITILPHQTLTGGVMSHPGFCATLAK